MCSIDPLLSHYGLTVDRTQEPHLKAFFLSHAHDDHVKGLNAAFFRKHSQVKVYLTCLTKELLMLYKPQLKAFEKQFEIIPYEEPVMVAKSQVKVTALPAFHCDGSAMFLFEFLQERKRVLYTGDFRFQPAMRHWPHGVVDTIYYDDTFQQLESRIPTLLESEALILRLLSEHKHVYINMSVLGFEPVLRRILHQRPQWQVFLDPALKDTWRGQQIRLLLSREAWTSEASAAKIWLTHRRFKKDWHPAVPVLIPTATKFLCEKWHPHQEQLMEQKEQHATQHGTQLYLFVFFVTHSNREELFRFFCHVPHKRVRTCDYDGIKQLKCLSKE